MLFKKQITKSFILPQKAHDKTDSDSIAVLLEEPDFAYLDETKPDAVNVIAVVSRLNFKASALFRLNKSELAICITFVKSVEQVSSGVSTYVNEPVLVVGTTYLNPEEQMPSAGRLLILDPYSLNLL